LRGGGAERHFPPSILVIFLIFTIFLRLIYFHAIHIYRFFPSIFYIPFPSSPPQGRWPHRILSSAGLRWRPCCSLRPLSLSRCAPRPWRSGADRKPCPPPPESVGSGKGRARGMADGSKFIRQSVFEQREGPPSLSSEEWGGGRWRGRLNQPSPRPHPSPASAPANPLPDAAPPTALNTKEANDVLEMFQVPPPLTPPHPSSWGGV